MKRTKQRCRCIPWDLIHHKNETALPCILEKITCAKAVLQAFSDTGCDCPLDCNDLKYSYSTHSELWDRTSFCDKEIKNDNNIFVLNTKIVNSYKFVDNPFGTRQPGSFLKSDAHRDCMKRKAFQFEISYAGSTGQVFVKRSRTSFAQVLSNIGNWHIGPELFYKTNLYFRRTAWSLPWCYLVKLGWSFTLASPILWESLFTFIWRHYRTKEKKTLIWSRLRKYKLRLFIKSQPISFKGFVAHVSLKSTWSLVLQKKSHMQDGQMIGSAPFSQICLGVYGSRPTFSSAWLNEYFFSWMRCSQGRNLKSVCTLHSSNSSSHNITIPLRLCSSTVSYLLFRCFQLADALIISDQRNVICKINPISGK